LNGTGNIIELTEVKLQVGCLIGPHELLCSWVGPSSCTFCVDKQERKLYFMFSFVKKIELKYVPCDMKLELLLRDLRVVKEVQCSRQKEPALMMLLQLWLPPLIFFRTARDDVYCSTSSPLLDDDDPWIRTTDFTPDKSIGRCFAYSISVSPRQGSMFRKLLSFFKQHRLGFKTPLPPLQLSHETTSSPNVRGEFFFVLKQPGVSFGIMFLINVLVHRGTLNVTSLTDAFYNELRADYKLAELALLHILSYTHPVFDAAKRLQQVMEWIQNSKVSRESSLGSANMVVRRLVFTPTRAYCRAPEVEMSNRVLRHFGHISERFLRVSFMDDNLQQLTSPALTVPIAPITRELSTIHGFNRTELYYRVLSILEHGFELCGLKYSFLAFSANQLRDGSAWFFAGNTNKVREWMGCFPRFNVAKYAARMGQCFSSTFSTLTVSKEHVIDLPDIIRNGYTFSDGIGKIAPDFALQVAESLQLEKNPPSAYQIRYAGYKGVVAQWSGDLQVQWKLGLRDSMKKFTSQHLELEVVGWSRFLPCYLNRQIVNLLTTLEVEDSVFEALQTAQLEQLEAFLNLPAMALEVLTSTCAGDLYSTAVSMLQAGFHPAAEPHLYNMLLSIRARQLQDLVSKTRIFVPQGRWLLGCLDETGLLQYGQCFIKVSEPSPTYRCHHPGDGSSVKVGHPPSRQVIQGKVVMTKNPCMHPGDIRVLDAIDVPELHHMIDCLVVPQTGERPHPNEASGSDLDGDLYFTCWDPRLIPPSGISATPMDYSAELIRNLTRPANIRDVVEFFAKHMVNDSLGVICNAHVVHADRSPLGALDENCLELAKLAAMAVDYPKTGKAASLPSHMRPKVYPDFMEKDARVTYQSNKVIGRLYRNVKRIVNEEGEHFPQKERSDALKQSYDSDLEYAGFEDFLEEAWTSKISYDEQLRGLMAHFGVQNEADVVTGHLVAFPHHYGRHLGDLKERMKNAYTSLRKEFRVVFETHPNADKLEHVRTPAATVDELMDLAPKASAWYHVTYHPNWRARAKLLLEDSELLLPGHLLSFPWIVVDVLGTIKAMKLESTCCH
jgi:RNA-dependent RNA polymerase